MLEQFRCILANDPRTRLGDPDGLQDERVAVRRLRAQLRVGRPLLDRVWADGLRADLRPVGRMLSAVRDLDVLHERLAAEVKRLPEANRTGGETLLADID